MKMLRISDWITFGVALTGLAWATWYVLATRANPIDEPEAAWFITPIVILVWIVTPFVMLSATGPLPEKLHVDPGESLDGANRWLFVIGLPVLAATIWVLGFVLAILIYVPVTVATMGERRIRVHMIILGLLSVIVFGGFGGGLEVNLPLWPGDLWPGEF